MIYMEMTINLPKWLSFFLHPLVSKKHKGYTIPTILVESPSLTASYYKEYLGFKIVYRNSFKRNGSIMILKESNLVLIKANDINKRNDSQRLILYLRRIDLEYNHLCKKVRFVKQNNSKSKENFIIKDCNGIEIAYFTN
jgi:hypothetical protein